MKRLSFILFAVTMASMGAYWTQCASMEMESARVYLQQNNEDESEQWALKAIEKEPSNPEPPYWLAVNIYANQRRWADMAAMFDMSLSRGTKFKTQIDQTLEKHWIDRFNAGANAINSIISKTTDDPEATADKAIKEFTNAIIIRPEKPEAYSSLATAYLEKGDLEKAHETMLKTLEIKDDDVATLVNLGILLSNEEKYEEANAYLQKTLELDPGNVNAIQRLAQNFDLLEMTEEAEAAYQRAIESAPDNPNLKYNLGVLFLKRKDYASAETLFLQSLELQPDDCDAISNVAVIYNNMEDKLVEAEKFLLKAAECDPEESGFWRQLVGVYMKMGERQKAEDALKKAKELGYKTD